MLQFPTTPSVSETCRSLRFRFLVFHHTDTHVYVSYLDFVLLLNNKHSHQPNMTFSTNVTFGKFRNLFSSPLHFSLFYRPLSRIHEKPYFRSSTKFSPSRTHNPTSKSRSSLIIHLLTHELHEHRFGDFFKDIHVDGTTKTVILKSVRKTVVSVGRRQGRRSDLPGRFSSGYY